MHIETLRTFCDLVETGSFSRAARLNFVTQSAVSQQLRTLERRYGKRLIERGPRPGAQTTDAGRLLYTEAKALLERFTALEERLRDQPDVIAGTVRVATVYSVGLHSLPPHMQQFLRAHPQVQVRLQYSRTDEVYTAVLAGTIDLGIVALPARRPQIEVVPLRADELALVLPPEHPLARRRRLRAADLDGQAFIAFDRDIPTRKLIDGWLRRRGIAVGLAMELDNIETIKRSVEAGLGLSILPRPALVNEQRGRTLVVRPLPDEPLSRALGVIRRRGRQPTPAALAFLDLVTARLG